MATGLEPNGTATAVATEPMARRIRTEAEASPATAAPPAKPDTTQRLLSLDAYRGLIMVTLAFNGFGLAGTAVNHLKLDPSDSFWKNVHHQFEHVEWAGAGYWDMIQPSFMFMVGVAMAFSYAKRRQLGQSYLGMLGHAMVRSLVLVLMGVFLSSRWELMNVLTQIGLGYTFLFLLWGRSFRAQAVAAVVILVGTWLLYVAYPYSGVDWDNTTVDKNGTVMLQNGVSKQWADKHLADVGRSWHKNNNVGQAIDLFVLNHLPVKDEFKFNGGGYQTINFLPSLATMLFGLMCGELLRTGRSHRDKLLILLGAGLAGLVLGLFLELTGICPIIKRIWTPAWALFSTGWCCLILMSFYGIIDVVGLRRWAFPLIVVGMNSIAMYLMGQLLRGWSDRTWRGLANDVFVRVSRLGDGEGALFEPMLVCVLTGMLFWFLCLWMYRQKIFIRI
jgi:heparan-alpha-glucosaminide N-acetyltransferase